MPVEEPFRGSPADEFPFPLAGPGGTAGDSTFNGARQAPFAPLDGVPAAASTTGPPAFVRPRGTRPAFVPPAPLAAQTPQRRQARIAFGLGLASLLVIPLVLGPTAIFLGIRAVRAGERRLGRGAISAGVAGTVLGVVGMILWATGVLPGLDEILKAG
jgi:hypothetical protein